MPTALPTGEVTFAFTDVVGSTAAFAEHGSAYVEALGRIQSLVAAHTERHDGVVVKTEGDGAFLAFRSAHAALDALTGLQEEVGVSSPGLQLRLRAGAHTGEATPVDGDYVSLAVHVAARVASAAGAGQVLVSQDVVSAARRPPLTEVGPFLLRDIPEPITLWRAAGDDTAPRATPWRRTNVAVAATSFVGRRAELEELEELSRSQRLVTVVGTGGLGKTRLVREHALRVADSWPGGVWLVELAPLRSVEQLWAAVGSALDRPKVTTPAGVTEELRQRGEVVVVLDNCEHVLDDVADVADQLLAGCPGLHLVATSREPLQLEAERVLRLRPLHTAGPEHRPRTTAEDLFVDRVTTSGRVLTPDELRLVPDVCAQLDGLPLALELAAAQAVRMPLRDLLQGVRSGSFPLQRRGGAERQRSLEALVRWSLDLLPVGEQRAFAVLSVFPGAFDPAWARAVLARVGDLPVGAAADLARCSLLDLEGDQYRMLESVRSVATAALAGEPALHACAYDALLSWAADPQPWRRGGELLETLPPDGARALEAVLRWALDTGQAASAGHVLSSLRVWSMTQQLSPEARDLALRVVAGPPPVTATELYTWAQAARLAGGLGNEAPVAADELHAVVTAARAAGHPRTLFEVLSATAPSLDRLGRYDEARPLHEESLALVEQHPELREHRAGVLLDLGVSAHLQGRLDEAVRSYRLALETAGDLDRENRIVCLANTGEALLDAGDPAAAAEPLRQGLAEAVGKPRLAAFLLGLIAEARAGCGAFEEARALGLEAERELVAVLSTDGSIAPYLERLRATLAQLPAPDSAGAAPVSRSAGTGTR